MGEPMKGRLRSTQRAGTVPVAVEVDADVYSPLVPQVRGGKRRSGRPPASSRPPETSRRELLDAAAQVFAERGYGAATVEEVIRRAGLSKGTFYWNFTNKSDLFLALVEDRLDRPARAAVAKLTEAPADGTPSVALSASLSRLVASERPIVLLLHEFTLAAARDPEIAALHRKRHATRRSFLASVLAARHEQTGVSLTIAPDQLAEAFLALADGLALRSIIEPNAIPPTLFSDTAGLVYDGLVLRAERGSARKRRTRGG
jgi:AcrR family transcriptional regulator